MARFLPWVHISQEQLAVLRQPPKQAGVATARQLLSQCCQLEGFPQQQQEILLDLYSYTLRAGQGWGLDDEKLSCLFGIVKETHEASVKQRLTVERSFCFFKDTLLNHSVQRPPFSIGVFNQGEMQTILMWMLDTYYRHYKLYQYAFTSRVTMSVTTFHPTELVELPPELLPLAAALTEAQHQQQLDARQRQREAEERAAAEAAAAAAEAARAEALQQEYEASLPEDIKQRVQAALNRELAYLRKIMEEQFEQQQAEVLAKIAQIEASRSKAASQ